MPTTRSQPRRTGKVTVAATAPRSAAAVVVPGVNDEDYVTAYRYGVLIADKHGKKEFAEVEPTLAEGWTTARGPSRLDWAQARPAVKDGYAGVVKVRPVKTTAAERSTKARTTARRKPAGGSGTKRAATSGRKTTVRRRSGGDNLAKRGPQDRNRISVTEPWEVDYWCERLGVTPAQLKRAVTTAGPMARDVRRELGRK